jgi:hypothetical protein
MSLLHVMVLIFIYSPLSSNVMITKDVWVISCCNWQDSTVSDCWVDVAWCKGWKIFHETCLPRF